MAAQARTFFVFSTFGRANPFPRKKKKKEKKRKKRKGEGGGGGFSRGRQTVQRSPEKTLFKGGREVLKGAKEGVSPSIKKCF